MERYREPNSLGGYIQVPICDKNTTQELSGDFTLPDYQPEIKKLLRIGATVLPPSKYIGNSGAEFAGNIDYYVLYMGSDNEIYCAPLTAEYKVDVPFDKAEDLSITNLVGYATISPDMISGRVTSPRKIAIKCRLKARARVFGDMPIEDGFGRGADDSIELLVSDANNVRSLFGESEPINLSDEIICDRDDGEIRVVSADGRALIGEVNCLDGSVSCRGEMYLKLLMSRENGTKSYTVTRKIPFSHNVAVEGVNMGSCATARATVTDMNINVDDGRIAVDVGMVIDTMANKQDTVRYIKDVYSTTHESFCKYKNVGFVGNGMCINGNFTLNDSMTLEEAGIAPTSTPIDTNGSVIIEEQGFKGGKYSASGKAKFNVLLEKDGEYSVTDIELPFKYECEGMSGGDVNNMGAVVCGEVLGARARIDGERIGIDAEIGMFGNMWENTKEEMLDLVSFGEELEKTAGDCIICYPSKSDSLWSVAKRYNSPISEISELNKLSSADAFDTHQSISNSKYLIIK